MTQSLFLALVGVVLLLYVLRFLRTRNVRQYSPAEAKERLAGREGILFLDVRTDGERKFNHIQGSLHIPLHQLRARAEELARHREREIVCYCQSGNRSVSAALILQRKGFRAASLRGGIVDWNFQHADGRRG
jgi:rhodanese-related sulfurtransferase